MAQHPYRFVTVETPEPPASGNSDRSTVTAAPPPPPVIAPPRPVRANMPQRQDDLLEWCMVYTATLLDDPALYDTPPEEADEIRRLVLAWDEARENWRTGRGKVLEKNLAKNHAHYAVRCHAHRIRKHRRISTEAKLALGFELAGLPRRRA